MATNWLTQTGTDQSWFQAPQEAQNWNYYNSETGPPAMYGADNLASIIGNKAHELGYQGDTYGFESGGGDQPATRVVSPAFKNWLVANGYQLGGEAANVGGIGGVNAFLLDQTGNRVAQQVYATDDSAMFNFGVGLLGMGALSAVNAGVGAAGGASGGAGQAASGGLFSGEGAGLAANQVGALSGAEAGGLGSLETTLGNVLGYESALPGMGAAGTTVGGAMVPGAAAGGSFWGTLGKAAIGPAISAGAQMIGANMGGKALSDATGKANDLQRYMYDTTRADNMPALSARNNALTQIQSLLADPSSLTKDPGYAFGLNQGQKTLANGAAARGMTYSGAQGKALQRYGQDYAGTKLDQSVNRLSNLANIGQAGASTIANAGGNYANQTANNLTALGDARAAQYMVNSNAIGNAVNGLTAYGQKQGWWGTPG